MSTQTVTTAEPSVAPAQLLKHIIKRKKNEDGTWPAEFEQRTLCGVLWDRPFLPGSASCEECVAVLKRELGL